MTDAAAPAPPDRAAAPEIRLVPLAGIDAEALPRDRSAAAPEALAELRDSILAHGVRQPIEIWEYSDADDKPDQPRYGLISGWRRLAAMRELHLSWEIAACSHIPALIRPAPSHEALLEAMVVENEIRADLSPWERARLLVTARDRGFFGTIDEAIAKLHRHVHRSKRARLRQLAILVEELDGCLHAPEALSQRQALRLAEACARGHADLLRATLASLGRVEPMMQWAALEPVLRDIDEIPDAPPSGPARPGRPRRMSQPRPGLVIRRERTRNGYALHFTGRDADSMLIDTVFDEIDRMFSPG